MESPLKLPLHVEKLARDLQISASTEKVLLDHLTATHRDTSLYHVYLRLGYSPGRAAFQHTPTRTEALQVLSEEFGQCQEDEYVHSDLRAEFFRIFKSQSIDQFSSAASLGLNSVSTTIDELEAAFEGTSLMDFWGNLTPMKRPAEDYETPEKIFDFEGRSSKGLRSVSLRVKEILRRKGKASYKEVADVLVSQLELPTLADRSKEEKNIRRRVYDAINVLIAAGILGRDGRDITMVAAEPSVPLEDDEELSYLKATVHNKREQLRDLAQSYMSLYRLIARNRTLDSPDRIEFPFIIVATEDNGDNSLSMSVSADRQQLSMRFTLEASIVGDSDVVKLMNLQPWDLEVLPGEVRRLLKESPLYLFS